jgi:hypothetical protein
MHFTFPSYKLNLKKSKKKLSLSVGKKEPHELNQKHKDECVVKLSWVKSVLNDELVIRVWCKLCTKLWVRKLQVSFCKQ